MASRCRPSPPMDPTVQSLSKLRSRRASTRSPPRSATAIRRLESSRVMFVARGRTRQSGRSRRKRSAGSSTRITRATQGAGPRRACSIRRHAPSISRFSFGVAVTGAVAKARRLLADKSSGDPSKVHGTGVAVHNLVAAFSRMRALWANPAARRRLTPEAAVAQCLVAPEQVVAPADGGRLNARRPIQPCDPGSSAARRRQQARAEPKHGVHDAKLGPLPSARLGACVARRRVASGAGGSLMEDDPIFSPLKFRNLTVKHRIFRSSISGRFDGEDGSLTQTRINWESKFAAGGVGAIISSYVPVLMEGRIIAGYATVHRDDFIPLGRSSVRPCTVSTPSSSCS